MNPAAKNIVILSDGTGQSYKTTKSNVLRLYEFLLKDPARQVAVYNPGIATSPLPLGLRPRRHIRHLLQLCLGFGLMEDVTQLYKALVRLYRPGDTIYLFGFSRGSFTVRALAALIHICGLLRPDDVHLVPDAIELFRTSESRIKKAKKAKPNEQENLEGVPIDNARYDRISAEFKSTFSQECQIEFMGIWDTVKAYGFFWPRSFPCLRHNPSVRWVRHAVALDERRSLFQMTGWGDRDDETEKVKEVWFRGDHSDVGGGHDDGNSRLADFTLAWMLGEATNHYHPILLDINKREEITKLNKPDSEPIPSPRSLDHGLQWWLSRCPRPELNNTNYPPSRPFKFRPSAVRKPIDHVERSRLRYHITVPLSEPRPQSVPAGSIGSETTLDVKWSKAE